MTKTHSTGTCRNNNAPPPASVRNGKLRILLAYKAHPEGESDPYTSLLPIGLGYLAALLKDNGLQARLANFSSLSWSEIEASLRREQPHILAVSVFTHNRSVSMRLARIAKRIDPSCFVVFGGPHATFCHEELLADCEAADAVIPGEGEVLMLELVRTIDAGNRDKLSAIPGIITRNNGKPAPSQYVDIERLPLPATAMDDAIGVDPRRQLEFIITSRGCPSSCSFCASPTFWGRSLRFRSPRSIVEEIKYIRDRYGLLYFSVRDDTFTSHRERVIDFCRLLLRERIFILWNCQSRVSAVDKEMVVWMKKAGCECIQFGVESGSPSILRKLTKKITPDDVRRAAVITREAGIHLSIYLITGVPGETADDVQATLRLMDEIRPHDGQVSPLAYYPGTPLFVEAFRRGAARKTMFRSGTGEAFLVRNDRFSNQSKKRLLQRLTELAEQSAFREADFNQHKKVVGYCHTTNLLMGEMYEEAGSLKLAEREYTEIVTREPDNPWGWIALGELHAAGGETGKARADFETVVKLVPGHVPAYRSLGELCLYGQDVAGAERYGREAQRLEGGGAPRLSSPSQRNQ